VIAKNAMVEVAQDEKKWVAHGGMKMRAESQMTWEVEEGGLQMIWEGEEEDDLQKMLD
jgi:hypothetical protein